MDMVLSVKDRGLIQDINTISKTKVRGVFSLLKNAQALETTESAEDGVRLYMGRGIVTFKDFREKHDAFLQKCIIQQHFFIPINSRKELMWPTEKDELDVKLEVCRKFELFIVDYFMNGIPNNPKKTRKPANSAPTADFMQNKPKLMNNFRAQQPNQMMMAQRMKARGIHQANYYPQPVRAVDQSVSTFLNADFSEWDQGSAYQDDVTSQLSGYSMSGYGLPKSVEYDYHPNTDISFASSSQSTSFVPTASTISPSLPESSNSLLKTKSASWGVGFLNPSTSISNPFGMPATAASLNMAEARSSPELLGDTTTLDYRSSLERFSF